MRDVRGGGNELGQNWNDARTYVVRFDGRSQCWR